jgi:nicotinamidase-related amidase
MVAQPLLLPVLTRLGCRMVERLWRIEAIRHCRLTIYSPGRNFLVTSIQLDAAVALIAVDLQHVTVSMPSASDMSSVVMKATQLAAAFRKHGRLVVLTQADLNDPPTGRTAVSDGHRPTASAAELELIPELDRAAGDVVISKRGWSAFAGTGLDDLLRERQITQVVLVGLATNYGIESTARHAYDLGYNVIIVSDAINNPNVEGHEHAMTRVLPALAQVIPTDAVIALLASSQ